MAVRRFAYVIERDPTSYEYQATALRLGIKQKHITGAFNRRFKD